MEKIELSPNLILDSLVYPLWESLDKNYKSQYRSNIWTQFESILRASTYVSSLQKFLERFVRYFPCSIPEHYVERLREIAELGFDREILKEIREKTAYYVLLVRHKKIEERKEYEVKQQQKEEIIKDRKEAKDENLFV